MYRFQTFQGVSYTCTKPRWYPFQQRATSQSVTNTAPLPLQTFAHLHYAAPSSLICASPSSNSKFFVAIRKTGIPLYQFKNLSSYQNFIYGRRQGQSAYFPCHKNLPHLASLNFSRGNRQVFMWLHMSTGTQSNEKSGWLRDQTPIGGPSSPQSEHCCHIGFSAQASLLSEPNCAIHIYN